MSLHQPLSHILASLPSSALLSVDDLPFPKVASGKVRDIFDLGDAFLIVASDRLSAFDVVLPDGIPGKGVLLTQISLFWFAETERIIPNHLLPNHAAELAHRLAAFPHLIPRSMLVRKLQPLPIEAVVRHFLSGSAWKCYLKQGSVFGIPVPAGLQESDKLPTPLFTPTTKAAAGSHDEPLSYDQCAALIGEARLQEVRECALKLFALGSAAAKANGLILADTKFEFGTDPLSGQLFLIDEALTPDSSRFWPAADFQPGRPQTAFDKQFVRDFLESIAWDKAPPGPRLPADVITQTRERYCQALQHILPND